MLGKVYAPGTSLTGQTNYTLPEDPAPATYWIIAEADQGYRIAEVSETNNVRKRGFRVVPTPQVPGSV